MRAATTKRSCAARRLQKVAPVTRDGKTNFEEVMQKECRNENSQKQIRSAPNVYFIVLILEAA
jgi:hypothetical protein